jgi:hypothetical protein
MRATTSPFPQIAQHENEKYFVDPNQNDQKLKFPSILSIPSVNVTVIVPSYNEESRRRSTNASVPSLFIKSDVFLFLYQIKYQPC